MYVSPGIYVSYCLLCCYCGFLPCCTSFALGLDSGAGGEAVLKDADHVHESAVGKYCSRLSGLRLLYSSVFLTKVGHALLQLPCPSVLQDAHLFLFDRQLFVLWGPAQLPHVSLSSGQSFARWFQPWHFKQRSGSLFVLST